MPASTASNQFGVPTATLRHKMAGSTPVATGKITPHSILGIDVENKLVNWLQTRARKGFPIKMVYCIQYKKSFKRVILPIRSKMIFLTINGSKKIMKRHRKLLLKQAEYIKWQE